MISNTEIKCSFSSVSRDSPLNSQLVQGLHSSPMNREIIWSLLLKYLYYNYFTNTQLQNFTKPTVANPSVKWLFLH